MQCPPNDDVRNHKEGLSKIFQVQQTGTCHGQGTDQLTGISLLLDVHSQLQYLEDYLLSHFDNEQPSIEKHFRVIETLLTDPLDIS